jgi:hypothetical protein
LLVEGNFASVGGQPRQQIFMLNLATDPAAVTGWTSPEFSQHCVNYESFYLRDAAWLPDDSTVYTAATGFHSLNWKSGTSPHGAVRHRDGVPGHPAVRDPQLG